MSELCTLAASVVLQSSASGTTGADALSHPSSGVPESALRSLDQEPQPSVGCDGHHAIRPSIVPEAETEGAIVDEVEFSATHLRFVAQNPALHDPLAQELASQDSEIAQDDNNSAALKGYSPRVNPPEDIAPVPLYRPFTTSTTKLRKHPPNSQPAVDSWENRGLGLNETIGENDVPAAQVTAEELSHSSLPIASSPVLVRQDIDWSNGHQSTLSSASPVGWPSLLHPSPQSEPPQSEPSPLLPSHQSALPSPLAPRLTPEANGVLQLPSLSPLTSRPQSGRQLYQQRWSALTAGKTYTRLPSNSFETQWQYASYDPTHEDWLYLLSREARSMAAGQGDNALTVIVGDSLSLWMPTEFLPQHRFWLNQSISGETAAGMIKRLYMFDQTIPDTIHVMAGINDLKNGATDLEVLSSLQGMMRQLRHRHPQAKVIIHSILPTRLPHLSSERIRLINQRLVQIAQQEGTTFLDLQGYFSDTDGHLRQDLTTDGLHLNYRGYTMWQTVINQFI